MRQIVPEFLESKRITEGPWATRPGDGFWGLFFYEVDHREQMEVYVDDGREGHGWEHVMLVHPHRWPNEDEVEGFRRDCWEADEAVMELIPLRSHVGPFIIHLWHPKVTTAAIPQPPRALYALGPWRRLPDLPNPERVDTILPRVIGHIAERFHDDVIPSQRGAA